MGKSNQYQPPAKHSEVQDIISAAASAKEARIALRAWLEAGSFSREARREIAGAMYSGFVARGWY